MANEILFVQEIEKREFLYNYNLPEYNRKDLTEQAWSEVARNRHLTVNECKEKWRNIRSSFLRSMKKSEKLKKPYYLSPYLQFVVPYTKHSQIEFIDDLRGESQMSDETDPDIRISAVKSEPDGDEELTRFEVVDVEASEMLSEKVATRRLKAQNTPVFRRRRRPFISRNPGETNFKRKHSEPSSNLNHNNSSRLSNSSMRYFLLSLLPDFESMTNDQIRMFKIKVMILIDNIKTNFSEIRESMTTYKETDRLQKRLINLLLKNLKKNT